MKIKGFLRNSFVDFPGRIAAVVWTPGCNFRCPFCYNRELVLDPDSLPETGRGEVLAHLEKERAFIDGLVVTGGEPSLQAGLAAFLEKAVALGVKVKLDTNGSRPRVVRGLVRRGLVHSVALDVKSEPVPGKYARAAGLSPQAARAAVARVRETLDFLLSGPVAWELRTTVVTGVVEEDDVLAIARFCGGRGSGVPLAGRYALQNFFPAPTLDPGLSGAAPWPPGRLEALRRAAAPFFREVVVRGRA